MSDVLPLSTPAPDFTLPVTPDQKLSLQELRGHPVILAFYPADWSPVCGDQSEDGMISFLQNGKCIWDL
jgi:peroxiredoxin